MIKTKVTYKENLHFTGELDGFTMNLDGEHPDGTPQQGFRPKAMLLTGLAGCTAMDVISILKKMRSVPDEFYVEAEAEITETHPKVFSKITVTYRLIGGNIKKESVERAVELSRTTYCGVSAMLSKAVPIDYKIIIE